MSPRQPAADTGRTSAVTHEPRAFESDMERHRDGDDSVYGSHGVQAETPAQPARPHRLSGRRQPVKFPR